MFNFKKLIKDIFFPKFCFGCGKEGTYLCQDCESVLEISENYFCLCKKAKRLLNPGKCSQCNYKNLSGLYFAVPYQDPIVKKLINVFKYEPFLKKLETNLSSLIIAYFCLIKKKNVANLLDSIIIPVPLTKKRLKWRGFNQAEEIGQQLAMFLDVPFKRNVLFKTKETLPQIKLEEESREKNIRNCFSVKNKQEILNQKILLVDDVYNTGSTMEECAKILKESGVKEVWGITIARE